MIDETYLTDKSSGTFTDSKGRSLVPIGNELHYVGLAAVTDGRYIFGTQRYGELPPIFSTTVGGDIPLYLESGTLACYNIGKNSIINSSATIENEGGRSLINNLTEYWAHPLVGNTIKDYGADAACVGTHSIGNTDYEIWVPVAFYGGELYSYWHNGLINKRLERPVRRDYIANQTRYYHEDANPQNDYYYSGTGTYHNYLSDNYKSYYSWIWDEENHDGKLAYADSSYIRGRLKRLREIETGAESQSYSGEEDYIRNIIGSEPFAQETDIVYGDDTNNMPCTVTTDLDILDTNYPRIVIGDADYKATPEGSQSIGPSSYAYQYKTKVIMFNDRLISQSAKSAIETMTTHYVSTGRRWFDVIKPITSDIVIYDPQVGTLTEDGKSTVKISFFLVNEIYAECQTYTITRNIIPKRTIYDESHYTNTQDTGFAWDLWYETTHRESWETGDYDIEEFYQRGRFTIIAEQYVEITLNQNLSGIETFELKTLGFDLNGLNHSEFDEKEDPQAVPPAQDDNAVYRLRYRREKNKPVPEQIRGEIDIDYTTQNMKYDNPQAYVAYSFQRSEKYAALISMWTVIAEESTVGYYEFPHRTISVENIYTYEPMTAISTITQPYVLQDGLYADWNGNIYSVSKSKLLSTGINGIRSAVEIGKNKWLITADAGGGDGTYGLWLINGRVKMQLAKVYNKTLRTFRNIDTYMSGATAEPVALCKS